MNTEQTWFETLKDVWQDHGRSEGQTQSELGSGSSLIHQLKTLQIKSLISSILVSISFAGVFIMMGWMALKVLSHSFLTMTGIWHDVNRHDWSPDVYVVNDVWLEGGKPPDQ